MSFRELRNFTEMMRALSYPRPISVESFRNPNFELVADCLYWMVKRYDPALSVSDIIDSEDDRVHFLTSVAQAFLAKARVKLNTRRLYAADGRAVKELLKIASVLYEAARTRDDDASAAAEEFEECEVSTLKTKLGDMKAARELSHQVTESGAKVYDLLEQEVELRAERLKALSFLDAVASGVENSEAQRYLDKCVQDAIDRLNDNVKGLEKDVAELQTEETTLSSKLKKKSTELERAEKRLRSLKTVRPAFMDEYERLEKELAVQYQTYVERYRNVQYLERELDLIQEAEREKLREKDRSMKRMQKRLKEEELKLLRGDHSMGRSGSEKHSRGDKTSRRSSSWSDEAESADDGASGERRGKRRGNQSDGLSDDSLAMSDDSADDLEGSSGRGSSDSDFALSNNEEEQNEERPSNSAGSERGGSRRLMSTPESNNSRKNKESVKQDTQVSIGDDDDELEDLDDDDLEDLDDDDDESASLRGGDDAAGFLDSEDDENDGSDLESDDDGSLNDF